MTGKKRDPKQIVVVSGKGGAGKTFVASALAWIAEDSVFADCDVDAANLHLILHPTERVSHSFQSGVTARISPDRCTGCGACEAGCRFAAVTMIRGTAVVDHSACEGCGVCDHVCPAGAVTLEVQTRGEWYRSLTSRGTLIHAHLFPGEENSGKLVDCVRRAAIDEARAVGADWILIDGPPGTGCAAKSSITGTDFVLLVAEPSVSGIHDVLRVAELTSHFGIPAGVLVNKASLSADQTRTVKLVAAERGLEYHGELPFSRDIAQAVTDLRPYPQDHDDQVTAVLRGAWASVQTLTQTPC